MKPDSFTRTEADAAAYEAILGRDEAIDDHAQPNLAPYCTVCQHGTKDYICGPCERERWRAHADEH